MVMTGGAVQVSAFIDIFTGLSVSFQFKTRLAEAPVGSLCIDAGMMTRRTATFINISARSSIVIQVVACRTVAEE
jgi:hypothetical protein